MANEKQNTEKARELTLHETAEAIANDLWERYSDNDMGPQDLSDFKADTAIAKRWLESHAAHVTADLTVENERLKNGIRVLMVKNQEIPSLERRAEAAESKLAALRASFPAKAQQAAEEILGQCQYCGGSGYTIESRSEHHPDCDGSCAHCPIAVQQQVQCQCTQYRDGYAEIILRVFGGAE
jgi:hypothetical protein